MNHRPSGLSVAKALSGFLQYKGAEGVSQNTMVAYEHDLRLWIEHTGDLDAAEVRSQHILSFLSYLRTDYVPRRISGDNSQKLTPKTIYNIYVSLASFFRWASREFQLENPVQGVPRPRVPPDAPVEPFKKEEVEALIKACDFSQEAVTDRRRKFVMPRPTAKRDKAILLTLLDTGLRAGELCALRIADVDMKTGRVQVRPGEAGKAKGGKGRVVYLGKSALRFLWRHLAEQEDGEEANAPLFVGLLQRPFNPTALRLVINSLGEKAGVRKCHPHRFRRTFAITYLRSGGDVFTLKALLGHSDLTMVQYYVRIADVDVEQAHRRASPADHWRL
jgi:integrase/recombinase XerD